LLWGKAQEGDRAALVKVVDMLDPTPPAPKQAEAGLTVKGGKVAVLVSSRKLDDMVVHNREELRIQGEHNYRVRNEVTGDSSGG
jgi:hypothetical protein